MFRKSSVHQQIVGDVRDNTTDEIANQITIESRRTYFYRVEAMR